MEFLTLLNQALSEKQIHESAYKTMLGLYHCFQDVLRKAHIDIYSHDPCFILFLNLVKEQLQKPYNFELYHQKIIAPTNYYNFGIDFLRPLVDKKASRILKLENVDKMQEQLNNNENVILFANHQTEVDPQLLSMGLENTHSHIASQMIFVAGDRVTTDPLAVPFSMGRNLLCIYSKRYIGNPPEKKEEKQLHNQKVMRKLGQLLAEGGKAVFVAPSGGRDRPNAEGDVEIAPFDPDSIEMFRLIAKQSKTPTHFYPFTLDTYKLLPPPDKVQSELGERRIAQKDGIRFVFGDEIDMENFSSSEFKDRHSKRVARATHIWEIVRKDYETLKAPPYESP